MEENKNTDRLCFVRQGENGMQVEIVGSSDTLMSMVHSAIMSHAELRNILMPVFMAIMKDDEFMNIVMNDVLSKLKLDDTDRIIDTE